MYCVDKFKKNPVLIECLINIFDIMFHLDANNELESKKEEYSRKLCHYLFLYKEPCLARMLIHAIPLLHEQYLPYFTILLLSSSKDKAISLFESLGYRKSTGGTGEEVFIKEDSIIHIYRRSKVEDVISKFPPKEFSNDIILSLEPWLFKRNI